MRSLVGAQPAVMASKGGHSTHQESGVSPSSLAPQKSSARAGQRDAQVPQLPLQAAEGTKGGLTHQC